MPRTPYCTGCGAIFPKMHLMINHRRQEKCGGRFLPEKEREQFLAAKNIRQFAEHHLFDEEKGAIDLFARGHLKIAEDLRKERGK